MNFVRHFHCPAVKTSNKRCAYMNKCVSLMREAHWSDITGTIPFFKGSTD